MKAGRGGVGGEAPAGRGGRGGVTRAGLTSVSLSPRPCEKSTPENDRFLPGCAQNRGLQGGRWPPHAGHGGKHRGPDRRGRGNPVRATVVSEPVRGQDVCVGSCVEEEGDLWPNNALLCCFSSYVCSVSPRLQCCYDVTEKSTQRTSWMRAEQTFSLSAKAGVWPPESVCVVCKAVRLSSQVTWKCCVVCKAARLRGCAAGSTNPDPISSEVLGSLQRVSCDACARRWIGPRFYSSNSNLFLIPISFPKCGHVENILL
ncbi:hypothetical protein GWK47_051045 [Chionoecetes opilio]|uniref:Uncharacterized protein n=1 Tax=Chionoecetes opilio TaxID=41210 RepID=A0A8J4Y2I1_CHIOP|nr:hypothetical protein GWK47_051045 [Chionoecetes opilio]